MKHKHSAAGRFLRPLLLALALLLLCGCSAAESGPSPETAPVLEGRHEREAEYPASFRTHLLSLDAFTLHMENRIYDEARLRGCAEILRSDLAAMERALGAEPEAPTVYLVGETPEGVPALAGTRLFCTPEELESGAYRPALAGATYTLGAQWQRVGLAAWIFGGEQAVDLPTYYAEPEHELTASCSALHLSPLLSDEETMRAARETARSLCAYALEHGGLSALRAAEDPAVLLPTWAESLGLSRAPVLPETSAEAAGLTLGTAKGRLCVLRVKNLIVYVNDDAFAREPDALYRWLCAYFAGMETVTERLRAEAPEAAALAEARLGEPVRITLSAENSGSYSVPERNEIVLSRPGDAWHESVHLLLKEPEGRPWLAWLSEALAEHFSRPAETLYAPVRILSDGYEAYLAFFAEVSAAEATADDLLFHDSVWKLYQELRTPEAVEYDDMEAYSRAYGISSLLLDGVIDRRQRREMYDLSVAAKRWQTAGPKALDGNALSYPEATVMYEYLALVYGADAVIDAYLKAVTPDEAFGVPYAELFAGAKAHYAGLYGDLLAVGG